MIHPQYYINTKKGDTVIYGKKPYRIQDDGKGFLHIIVFEQGKRKKIAVGSLPFFEPGSWQDYIFNGWFEVYDSYYTYRSFIENEINAI